MKSGIYNSVICFVLLVPASSSGFSQFPTDGSWGTVRQGQPYVITPGGFKNPPGPGEGAGVVVDPFRFVITGSAGEEVKVVLTLPDAFASDVDSAVIPLTNWTYSVCDGCEGSCFCSGAYIDSVMVTIHNNGVTLLTVGATFFVPDTASLGSYTAALRASYAGKETTAVRSLEVTLSTDAGGDRSVPLEFSLAQNYPNPFNPSTTISYTLPAQSLVTLKVFNVLGQEIATLVDGIESPGSKSVQFDGGGLPSGAYFYRLQAGSYTATKMLMIVR
jgi:hypothetical protein